jgi:hypothetical protein
MNKTTIGWMLACALGIAIAGISPSDAQSTLGGAKPQQNKIGGVAKPPVVVGGATTHATTPPTPPKPAPVIGMTKPGSPTPAATGASSPPAQTAGNPRPNPPPTPSNKSSVVVTASSTPKCASGTCPPKSPRP